MKASIGRTVIVLGVQGIDAQAAPAVITRAFSERDTADGAVAVNLTIFPDCSAPFCHSSVMLYDTEAQARAAHYENRRGLVAHWPTLQAAASRA